jgi:hypothetical protein
MCLRRAKLPRSHWAENRRVSCVLALFLLIGYLLAIDAGHKVAAEPAAPAYLAGGVTTIPYTDPIGRQPPRRDVYLTQDEASLGSDWLRWVLLLFLVGLLTFLLGYFWRPRPVKEKPSWEDIEAAIGNAFDKRVAEANAHLRGNVQGVAVNVLNEARTLVLTAAEGAFKK